jgi:hypothetical protein
MRDSPKQAVIASLSAVAELPFAGHSEVACTNMSSVHVSRGLFRGSIPDGINITRPYNYLRRQYEL